MKHLTKLANTMPFAIHINLLWDPMVTTAQEQILLQATVHDLLFSKHRTSKYRKTYLSSAVNELSQQWIW